MHWLFFSIAIAQCILLWVLSQTGMRLRRKATSQQEAVEIHPPARWPHCTLLIPVGAVLPSTEQALLSLLQQNYPSLSLRIITAQNDPRPATLVKSLTEVFPQVIHVQAPEAITSGQKNMNLLCGLESADPETEVFVFCDSTHIAREDFLKCLVYPIARGECEMTTGYHQVIPEDQKMCTLGYTLSVLFMRFLQGIGNLTQPWGGAMAITRHAFNKYGVAELWKTHIVDDCSLAARLIGQSQRFHLCPGALLDTHVKNMGLGSWRDWLLRQILFLKFCIPAQWLTLCLVSTAMLIPPLWCFVALLMGLTNTGSGSSVFMALIWLVTGAWLVTSWCRHVPAVISPLRWFCAFFCSSLLFFDCCMRTISARSITWQGITYIPGKGGKLNKIIRGRDL